MKVDRSKVEQWLRKYRPKCQVCGKIQWDLDDAGVAFMHPENTNLQRMVVPLICHECGNMILLDKEYFKQ